MKTSKLIIRIRYYAGDQHYAYYLIKGTSPEIDKLMGKERKGGYPVIGTYRGGAHKLHYGRYVRYYPSKPHLNTFTLAHPINLELN